MEKINYRFLNYKRYSKFLEDLNNNKVREDAIVFIQDNLRIWARGNEYVCDGPSAAKINLDTLTFKNGTNNTIMTILSTDGTITFTDSDGRTLSVTCALDSTFKTEIEQIKNRIALEIGALATVAKTGQYSDLINKPDPIVVDSLLSDSSTNPVQNKVVYDAIKSKADSSTFDLYVQKSTYMQGMYGKQDKLTAGFGIDIDQNNKISSTLDTQLYIVVTQLPSVEDANPNKIYLLETPNGHGGYTYQLYRVRNGQWIAIGAATPDVNLSLYLKSADAANLYQPKGNYATEAQLSSNYTLLSTFEALQDSLNSYALIAYVLLNYQPKDDYALVSWVTKNFVNKADVYTSTQYDPLEDVGGGSSVIDVPSQGGTSNITVDTELSLVSANPVANYAITAALSNKADKSSLLNYYTKELVDDKIGDIDFDDLVTKDDYESDLAGKLDVLIPDNRTISIVNNVISCILDTDVFVIVSTLPIEGNPNKIYLVETVLNDETSYVEWRWRQDPLTNTWDWVEIGQKDPGINLTDYLTKSEASSTYITGTTADGRYQAKGDYITRTESQIAHTNIQNRINAVEDELDGYATTNALELLRLFTSNTYQRKGNYALAEDVSAALTILQLVIDQKYVLKRDVYNPNNTDGWSTADATLINVAGANGGSAGTGIRSNMVTLSQQEYQSLVDNNMIDETTYYFTYEGEEITTNWTFGGTFPIILSGPEGLGTFPIELT